MRKYKRVLLKLSGEIIGGADGDGIDRDALCMVAEEIKGVSILDVDIGIVIGGGNIFRGSLSKKIGIDRVTGDYMGMLGTMMDALALQDILESKGITTRVMSALEMAQLSERYIRRRAMRHFEKKRTLIFACGTGNPYFTTDTAASLRAIEIGAEALLKGTKVDGAYAKDPMKNPRAKKFSRLTYLDVLNKKLQVIDATAVTLCMENNLPIIVFNIRKSGNLKKIIQGESVGTIIN